MVLKNWTFIVLLALVKTSKPQDSWTGKWFPSNPYEKTTEKPPVKLEISTFDPVDKSWRGKWFPHAPEDPTTNNRNFEQDRIMGIPNKDCDDGETNLATDFDPESFDHSKFYLCLEPNYKPNPKIEQIQTNHDVNKFYTPVHKCMNETLTYEQRVPTLGYHRPLWAKYGEYQFLPPQRWLHNIEHGAIVALYHPCANKNLIDRFKKIVKNCLFRHIITPYRNLTEERPFALAGWAISLEFSVVDETIVEDFIKKYALTGPEKTPKDGQYSKFLIESAKTVSQDDAEICPKGI